MLVSLFYWIGRLIGFVLKTVLSIVIVVFVFVYFVVGDMSLGPDKKETIRSKPNTASGLIKNFNDPRFKY